MSEEQLLAMLLDPSPVQESALSEVLAQQVWDGRKGRTADWADLGPVTQEVQRETARRHLGALREFLSR